MADATRRVSVRLSLDDAAKVKQGMRDVGDAGTRSLDQIKGGAERAARSLSLIDAAVRVIQFATVAAGLRALVGAGDALTQSMGRLSNSLGSVERAGEVYEALYRNALQTGVSVRESADAFNRFSIAAREIGATSDEVLTLVTGLQRVALASGASTTEVQSATQQLAQALASGVLQGDELRSILENLPTLAQALAQELGVGIGELRRMGAAGELQAGTVFPALLRAVQRVNGEFERAPLAIGRAFGQLTAAADQFLGRLDRAIGLSSTLASVLSRAARALDATRRGVGLSSANERLDAQRAARDLLAGQIAQIEADQPPAAPRRGSVRSGLVGISDQQAGVDRARRLAELRQQYQDINAEVVQLERESEARTATERTAADQRAADMRRQRATQDAQELREQLDARFRISREFDGRMARLREQEASGAIDGTERQRLEGLATRQRDEALRGLEGSVRRVTAAQRDNRDAERETNDVLRDREALIRRNENAQEKYARRLSELGVLAERAERAGRPLPNTTIERERQAALDDLTRATQGAEEATRRTGNTARELGLTFTSAFEDAIVRGKSLQDVIKGIGADLLRIGTRRLVTEPLVGFLERGFGALTGGGASGLFDRVFSAAGSALGSIFHGGGLVGAGGTPGLFPAALWAGAPRFHEGGWPGLRADEVPAILQRGERVLSRDEVRRGSGGGQSIVFNITTPDAASFRASQGQILADLNRAMARGRRGL